MLSHLKERGFHDEADALGGAAQASNSPRSIIKDRAGVASEAWQTLFVGFPEVGKRQASGLRGGLNNFVKLCAANQIARLSRIPPPKCA